MKVRGVFPVGIMLILLLAVSSSPLSAQDEYELKDGTIIKGTVVSETAYETQIETESGEIIIIKVKIDRVGGVYKIELKSGKPIIGEVTFEGEQKGENMIRLNTKEGAVELFWDNIESINEWVDAHFGEPEEPLTDIDGNVYQTVRIGNQVWMAENLKVKHYNDGTPINHVSRYDHWGLNNSGIYAACSPHLDWNEWCEIDPSSEWAENYGLLYNWYAITDDDRYSNHRIAPEGWRVPTDDDWKILERSLGMSEDVIDTDNRRRQDFPRYQRGEWEGCRLSGKRELWEPLLDEVNIYHFNFGSSGFNAVPAGIRSPDGHYSNNHNPSAYFWTSTSSMKGWARGIITLKQYGPCTTWRGRERDNTIHRFYMSKNAGLSVRLIKDE